jgi:hypothetical protein
MAKLFGESISKDVVKQLEQRESILATGVRDSQHLRYLNEKTAWVRAISGINRIEPDTSEYSANMAKEFILSGGRLKWNAETKKFEPRATNINFGQQEDGRYSYTETLGIRPEPGITSFSITHKNRFGTIREANLSFVVWTRDDLLKAERLFLRPGAQVVVEWGNSTYVDNEGTVENMPTSDQYNEFFNTVYVEKIYEIINKTKKDSSYNYDGFLGLVTNFTWKYRMDGGYDCSISIVSRSAVLESLTLLKPVTNKDNIAVDSYFKTDEKVTLLHYLAKVLNNAPLTKLNNIATLKDLEVEERLVPKVKDDGSPNYAVTKTIFSWLFSPVKVTQLEYEDKKEEISTNIRELLLRGTTNETFVDNFTVYGVNTIKTDSNEYVNLRYISLRYLLVIINSSFINQQTPKTDFPEFFTGDDDSIEEQKYKTFNQHISFDPYFAILPTTPTFSNVNLNLTESEKKILNGEDGISPYSLKIGNITNNIVNNPNTEADSILDIHVNMQAIVEILDSYLGTDGEIEKINVLDFVNNILRTLSSALGGINSFDINFDESLQKYVIVDRELINEKLSNTVVENKGVEVINVIGLKSTVSSVSIESKITSQLTSMIAISNQVPEPGTVNANQPLIDWNKGTTNRFYLEPSTDSTDQKTQEELDKELDKALEKLIEERNSVMDFYLELKQAYDFVNGEGEKENFFNHSRKLYKKEFFNKAKANGNLVYKKMFFKNSTEKNIADQGLIPLELSITLDGISGLKIGQVFKIGRPSATSNILPEQYDDYGFIVTGLDSTIETSGKWLTTIKAQTFKLL